MSNSRSFLQDSLSGLRPEMSETTQAHMAIPTSTVRNVRQAFEARISAHQYERDSVYICRAARNMEALIHNKRTYAEQLRSIEDATLFDIPTHLVGFLRDHDNLYRAAFRSRSVARKARACPDIDLLEQVTYRLDTIRIVYYVNFIEMTRSETERRRLMHDSMFVEEFDECTQSLQDEVVRQLTRLEQLLPSPEKGIELENIGPDHNVDDFGQEVSSMTASTGSDDRDQIQRCCICLETWSETHPAFLITICKHTVGKPCLSQWLNSTSRNANLCPHCRTLLCKRRARQPKGITSAILSEHHSISERLDRAIIMIGDFEKLQDELFGTEAAAAYSKEAMYNLNYRLFENDIGFCLECEGGTAGKWGVRRVIWH